MKRRSLITTGLLSLAASTFRMGRQASTDTCCAEDGILISVDHSSFTKQALSSFEREAFLVDLQQRCYRFFLEAADPETGLISDRAHFYGDYSSAYGSSAACGFGLVAHCIAGESSWGDRLESQRRVLRLLESLHDVVQHERGFAYHFFDTRTGQRWARSEVSSIDTALMVAGAMVARQAFSDDPEIRRLADQIYERVEWTWLLGKNNMLHMGWTPEDGFIPHQWDTYSELVILVLLAIGAPAHAISPECWQAWRREPVLSHRGKSFLHYPPLFVHQYPYAFFDMRNLRSMSGRSYWDNAVRAHHAQIDFMTALGRRYPEQFGHYGPDLWGLTSSDSIDGYRDWGGPYEADRVEPDRGIDGSVVPSAAAGGLAMVPDEAMRTLLHQRDSHGDVIYGRYGFVNAYNPSRSWVGQDVIGIDTGISLIMAENLRTGSVWNSFMSHPSAEAALRLAGFEAA